MTLGGEAEEARLNGMVETLRLHRRKVTVFNAENSIIFRHRQRWLGRTTGDCVVAILAGQQRIDDSKERQQH